MSIIEYFVYHIYSPKKRCEGGIDINELRREKFKLYGNDLRVIPPSKSALLQHTKRAAYQVGYL